MLAAGGGGPVALACPRQAGSHSCPARCPPRQHCPDRAGQQCRSAVSPRDPSAAQGTEAQRNGPTPRRHRQGALQLGFKTRPLSRSPVSPHSVCRPLPRGTAGGNAPRERRAGAPEPEGPRGLGRRFVCGGRRRCHPGSPPVPVPAPRLITARTGAKWRRPAFSRGKRVRGAARAIL